MVFYNVMKCQSHLFQNIYKCKPRDLHEYTHACVCVYVYLCAYIINYIYTTHIAHKYFMIYAFMNLWLSLVCFVNILINDSWD